MQTFYPIPSLDYSEQAKVLDNKRLNKQALEGWQILMVLLEMNPHGEYRSPRGWRNHPAVKLWRGHEVALFEYIVAMCEEWRNRGYKTTIDTKALATIEAARSRGLILEDNTPPDWVLDSDKLNLLAASHRKALLVKNYEYYSQFNWTEDTGEPENNYEYVWY